MDRTTPPSARTAAPFIANASGLARNTTNLSNQFVLRFSMISDAVSLAGLFRLNTVSTQMGDGLPYSRRGKA